MPAEALNYREKKCNIYYDAESEQNLSWFKFFFFLPGNSKDYMYENAFKQRKIKKCTKVRMEP